MTIEAARIDQPAEDPVSNVLKWILLVVAVASFAILGWTTKLTYEAAPPLPGSLRHVRRHRPDVGGRYSGRQGRLSESRPDGLRQPLRHGVVFRRGLHRRQSCAPRHADRRKHRHGKDRQGAVGSDGGGASRGQGGDAGRASRRRSDQGESRSFPNALAAAIPTLRGRDRRSPCCITISPRAGPRPTASISRAPRRPRTS